MIAWTVLIGVLIAMTRKEKITVIVWLVVVLLNFGSIALRMSAGHWDHVAGWVFGFGFAAFLWSASDSIRRIRGVKTPEELIIKSQTELLEKYRTQVDFILRDLAVLSAEKCKTYRQE